jgi:hypothetical protein
MSDGPEHVMEQSGAEDADAILTALGELEPQDVEQLAVKIQREHADVVAALTHLEEEGRVRPEPLGDAHVVYWRTETPAGTT